MSEEIKEGYTRISDVASAYANYGKINPNVLNYAADRGKQIHDIIHHITNDVPVPDKLMKFCDKPLDGYVKSFEQFWAEWWDSKIIAQEKRFYEENMLVTGQPDMIVEKDGKTYLFDWKATQKVGKHWAIQASGYCYQTWFPKIDHIIFVKLDKDGKKPTASIHDPDKKLFAICLDLYYQFMKDQTFAMEME